MGNSLREALLQAGLAAEEPAEKPTRRRPRRGKGTRPPPADSPPAPAPATPTARPSTRSDAVRSRAVARDPLLNPNAEKAQRRKRRQDVLDLAERQKHNHVDAERTYNFLRGKRVKHLYVTDEQHAALVAGDLSIVGLEGQHYLVLPSVAEQIHALATDAFVHHRGGDTEPVPGSDEGSHPVPDDLVW